MPNTPLIALLLSCVALSAGCQSAPPLPVVVDCPAPPAPPAWAMEPTEPTFTPRLLKVLSE